MHQAVRAAIRCAHRASREQLAASAAAVSQGPGPPGDGCRPGGGALGGRRQPWGCTRSLGGGDCRTQDDRSGIACRQGLPGHDDQLHARRAAHIVRSEPAICSRLHSSRRRAGTCTTVMHTHTAQGVQPAHAVRSCQLPGMHGRQASNWLRAAVSQTQAARRADAAPTPARRAACSGELTPFARCTLSRTGAMPYAATQAVPAVPGHHDQTLRVLRQRAQQAALLWDHMRRV